MIKVKKFIYKCKLIEDYLKENKLNKKQFCERCNICLLTLNRFYQYKRVSIFILVKVVDILRIRVNEFLVAII